MITDLGKNPSRKKISKVVSERIQENWITSYQYNDHEPSFFEKNNSIPWSKKGAWFNAILLYVHNIAKKTIQMDLEKLEGQTANEVEFWDRQGMLCVYTSVLHASLLHELGIAKSQELQLIQGYYKHISGGYFRDILDMSHVGVHAWITLCGGVLDISIIQEQAFFDFETLPWIVEKVPVGMELTGWQEDWDLIKRYARKIAQESGMTYYEWIAYHKKEIARMIIRTNHEGIEFIAS